VLSRPPIELLPARETLRRLGLTGRRERPFPHDGWSGAELSIVARGRDRFVLKRDSPARDWIARATADGPVMREAWFAASGLPLPGPISAPYLGAGRDDDGVLIVMPDLTGTLIDWEAPITIGTLDRVIDAMARLHANPWPADVLDPGFGPWCPLPERLLLLARPMAERYLGWGGRAAVAGERFVAGWDAFDRLAPPVARELIGSLAADVSPLVTALRKEDVTLLHGDLKLANIGIAADGSMPAIDWQMVMVGPVAVELGWFLVSNSACLPLDPSAVLALYAARNPALGDDGAALAWIVGLLLRGWRKGLDADAGATLASGVSGRDDLAEWCARSVEAARRIL
jgi:phosphotransferase family enzyme